MKLSTRIDSCVNHEAIVDLRKHKFTTALNELDDNSFNDFLNERLRNCPVSNVETITPDEVCLFASSLANNECPKNDGDPHEKYKF